MNQKSNKSGTVLLDELGQVYQNRDGKVVGLLVDEAIQTTGLARIVNDPTQHFFKTPYHSAVYVVDGTIVGSINIHPSSFYPGSPFDTFKATEKFYTEGKLMIPRFYLYPSGICNSSCGICQFHNLNRFEGKPFS